MIDLHRSKTILHSPHFSSICASSIYESARTILFLAFAAIFGAAIIFSSPSLAEEIVIADDGSEILLRDDGSWVQLSRDRHATSRTGARIKLSPDGRWKTIEDNARHGNVDSQDKLPGQIPSDSTELIQSPALTNTRSKPFVLLLKSAEVLKVKSKTLKSSRIDTRTVYNLSIKNLSNRSLDLGSIDSSDFKTFFSNGRKIPVLTVENDTPELAPNNTATLRVIADGSPRWFNIKYISVAMAENTLADHPEQILSINMPDVAQRTVEAF